MSKADKMFEELGYGKSVDKDDSERFSTYIKYSKDGSYGSTISFESITRHRRKWIELHPEINVKAKEKRQEEEQEYYLEYARRI